VTVRRSVMLGCGSYLPSRILTNADLARQIAIGGVHPAFDIVVPAIGGIPQVRRRVRFADSLRNIGGGQQGSNLYR